jgi:ribosomal protein S18 acetylase RimI-like enzyme
MSLSDRKSLLLDNPVWHSMVAAHTSLADLVRVGNGGAGRYQRDVSPFGALAEPFDEHAWSALGEILGGHPAVLIIEPDQVPDGWEVMGAVAGVQMEGTHLMAEPDPDVIPLGPADVPEVLALIERTRPGPFLARTIEMGAYVGVRRQGSLIAMAGERLHPPGWTEISAVCTDEGFRGQGLGTRLMRAVALGIRQRGEQPFLHAAATNDVALRLYRSLGFEVTRTVSFTLLRSSLHARKHSGEQEQS